jgi:hypothetical protein
MPRYFFHVSDGADLPDNEGSELEDLAAAKRQAAILLGRLMADAPGEVWRGPAWKVEVTDERGLSLFAVQVSVVEPPQARRFSTV